MCSLAPGHFSSLVMEDKTQSPYSHNIAAGKKGILRPGGGIMLYPHKIWILKLTDAAAHVLIPALAILQHRIPDP